MTERQARVLQLVAEAYIETAHPVPSGHVAERLEVSSATVRNEFAVLESDGLLQQPHTSAGRIPTALGFRTYALTCLPPEPLSPRVRRHLGVRLAGAYGDQFYALVSRLASELSGYAVTVKLPPDDALHIVEIHLSTLSSRRLLAVVVLENGLVRQLGVELDPVPDDEIIDDAERNIRQLDLPLGGVPQALRALAANTSTDLRRTLQALAGAWHGLQPPRLFSDGLTRLLAEPEGDDPFFVRTVVAQVEGVANSATDPEGSGSSSSALPLGLHLDDVVAKVVASFPFGSSLGTFTLVGPARMRYPAALTIAHEFGGALANRYPTPSSGREEPERGAPSSLAP